MLGLLRKNSKHWLVIALVAMAVIGMSFFFGYSFRDDGGNSYAAKVDGDPIQMTHFIDRYRNVLEYYKRQLGGNADESLLKSLNIKQKVLSGMVQGKILSKAALKNDFVISSRELRDSISSIPIFQDNGKFSMDRYKGYLAYAKYSPRQFETERKEELLVGKMQDLISKSSKASNEEIKYAYLIDNEKIELS
ncbi:MAG: SurA N-terminal domain-containing protein, partial [Oligoflexia bacterium]|nr:SurA N-terminal domain-containing protein [Oligoflexia bacterium]